jgi:hypothetical protein
MSSLMEFLNRTFPLDFEVMGYVGRGSWLLLRKEGMWLRRIIAALLTWSTLPQSIQNPVIVLTI